MTSADEYRLGIDEFRKSVDEYENAVDALVKLAESRGQGDSSIPLVVSRSDDQLLKAIDRELTAGRAVSEALQQLQTLRLK